MKEPMIYSIDHEVKFKKNTSDRDIAVCREITKMFEEVLRMKISAAIKHFEAKPPKGEFVLVI